MSNASISSALKRTTSSLRYSLIVLGASIGLGSGFSTLFNGTLPFFLLPISKDFAWGRGTTSTATVLAMLGVTLASPFMGRFFDRVQPHRVIGLSVVVFSACLFTMSIVPASLFALGTLCLCIGLSGAATTMVGYVSVLPRWFDRRLGLTFGLVGLGGAASMALAPFVSSRLIAALGWRDAYQALAAAALVLGLTAVLLLRPRRGETPPVVAMVQSDSRLAALDGLSFRDALRDLSFWLLFAVTFLVPFSVLGVALHGAALFADRGFTTAQAATGIALGGIGAITARLTVGALLDRLSASRVATVVFIAAAVGLLINSSTTNFALMCIGTMLGGAAMGAEGDLLPFMVRRYFGMRSFGAIFGSMHSAYALGGLLGPIAYGYTFDHAATYRPIMLVCSVLCLVCAVVISMMGKYRYGAELKQT